MALYTFDYNFAYSPSAPFVTLEVGAGSTTAGLTLSAMIDSGADATLLPLPLLKRLRAPRLDTRILRTVTGVRTPVSLFRVWLRIGPAHLRNVHAIGIETTEGAILGRDVLNQLIVTLNGLAAVTEISQ